MPGAQPRPDSQAALHGAVGSSLLDSDRQARSSHPYSHQDARESFPSGDYAVPDTQQHSQRAPANASWAQPSAGTLAEHGASAPRQPMSHEPSRHAGGRATDMRLSSWRRSLHHDGSGSAHQPDRHQLEDGAAMMPRLPQDDRRARSTQDENHDHLADEGGRVGAAFPPHYAHRDDAPRGALQPRLRNQVAEHAPVPAPTHDQPKPPEDAFAATQPAPIAWEHAVTRGWRTRWSSADPGIKARAGRLSPIRDRRAPYSAHVSGQAQAAHWMVNCSCGTLYFWRIHRSPARLSARSKIHQNTAECLRSAGQAKLRLGETRHRLAQGVG